MSIISLILSCFSISLSLFVLLVILDRIQIKKNIDKYKDWRDPQTGLLKAKKRGT